MSAIVVMFACNDERGMLTPYVDQIAIPDESITLTGPRVAYREGERVKVGRRTFAHDGINEWVGNWCWNAAMMDDAEAMRLVRYLGERGWCAEECPCEGPFAALFDERGAIHPPSPGSGR